MKYYSLKYKQIKEGLGQQRMWKITINPGLESDEGLLEHEKLHVRQWYVTTALIAVAGACLGLFVHPMLFAVLAWSPFSFGNLMQMAWFRRTMELAGYKIQAKYAVPEAIKRFVEILVKMGVSRKRAEKELL
jgi:hypothetical protein